MGEDLFTVSVTIYCQIEPSRLWDSLFKVGARFKALPPEALAALALRASRPGRGSGSNYPSALQFMRRPRVGRVQHTRASRAASPAVKGDADSNFTNK